MAPSHWAPSAPPAMRLAMLELLLQEIEGSPAKGAASLADLAAATKKLVPMVKVAGGFGQGGGVLRARV